MTRLRLAAGRAPDKRGSRSVRLARSKFYNYSVGEAPSTRSSRERSVAAVEAGVHVRPIVDFSRWTRAAPPPEPSRKATEPRLERTSKRTTKKKRSQFGYEGSAQIDNPSDVVRACKRAD